MSEYLGKREEERIALGYFLAEYEHVMADALELIGEGERPDFLCQRGNGDLVGVELTQIGHTPPVARDLAILFGTRAIDAFSALDLAVEAAERKERKRASASWTNAENTILVLQLVSPPDVPLGSLFTSDAAGEFEGLGFTEVWILDNDTLEQYGRPTLFGLYPKRIWGPKERSNWWEKPYG